VGDIINMGGKSAILLGVALQLLWIMLIFLDDN
jgi:hypothetical protein